VRSLPHRFTLACAVAGHRRSVLCGTFLRVTPTRFASTLPCGAPTFLDVTDAAATQSTHRPAPVLQVGERSCDDAIRTTPSNRVDRSLSSRNLRAYGIDSRLAELWLPGVDIGGSHAERAEQPRIDDSRRCWWCSRRSSRSLRTRIRADQGSSPLRASGLPALISTNTANLMGLTKLPARAADDFVLTDQRGRTMPFASFKGRTVVLEFMDPHLHRHLPDRLPRVRRRLPRPRDGRRQGGVPRGQREQVPHERRGNVHVLPGPPAQHDPDVALLHRPDQVPRGGLARLQH